MVPDVAIGGKDGDVCIRTCGSCEFGNGRGRLWGAKINGRVNVGFLLDMKALEESTTYGFAPAPSSSSLPSSSLTFACALATYKYKISHNSTGYNIVKPCLVSADLVKPEPMLKT